MRFGGLLASIGIYSNLDSRKPLVTFWPFRREIHRHPGVMDGTTAGTGAGTMIQPLVKNIILVSADQVAIDARSRQADGV